MHDICAVNFFHPLSCLSSALVVVNLFFACVFADKSCFATLRGLVTSQYVSVLPATMHPCLYCYLSDVTAMMCLLL